MPETWVPTCTVVTACSVPVAATTSATAPRVTSAVATFGASLVAAGVVSPHADAGARNEQDSDDQVFRHALHGSLSIPSSFALYIGREGCGESVAGA